MAKSETNNSGSSPFPIFGRVQELAYLHDRIERPGLTTLAARPQQGKTRLFEKLRDDLRAPTSGDQTHLIGYAVATAEYPDLLLRSIENLYTHWLKDSDFYSQAKAAIAQQKGKWMNWLGKSGESLADLLRFKDPTGLSTKAVQGWFTQLLNANETLKTGGFTLPRLSYEQARDLLQLVYDITDKPVVLVFDAFEQSPDTEKERGNLKLFLEKMYDWPPTHCLLACRAPAKGEAEDLAYTIASELARDYATAELYTLKPMQLDALDQRDNVLAFLHEKVPATRSMKDDEVLALLDGYPGTLRRWHDIKPTDRDALVQAAENAQKTRYPEMPGIFDALLADQDHPGLFEAAARLTLRPEMPSITVDDPLVALALKEDGEHLDGLTSAELLEETDQTYQFGLTARYEYARRVLMETPDWKQKLKTIVEAWVIDLAGQIRALDASEAPYALALAVLTEKTVAMSQAYYGVCMSAVSVLGMSTDIDAIRSSVDLAKKEARISILVAKGLTNATTLTETLDQTQPIIDALRQLSTAHPDQPVLREQLAKGLTNATTLTETLDQTQPIIDALRQLSTAHPDQPVLREQLAKGLFSATTLTETLDQTQPIIDALRQLSTAHPDQPVLREQLAKGLFSATNRTETLDQAQPIIDALRQLSTAHPDQPVLRETLAKGLTNATNRTETLDQTQPIIDALRQLSTEHPDQPVLREQLAKGLTNATTLTETLDQTQPIIDALRQLSTAHPDQPVLREQLAKGLFSATTLTETLDQTQPIIDALRQLSTAHPDQPVLRETLAKGLTNATNLTETLDQTQPIIDALRQLSTEHPDQPVLREQLAKGLTNATNRTETLDQAQPIIDALRQLSTEHPDQPVLREQLAKGLTNATTLTETLDQTQPIIDALRQLSTAHPDQPVLREQLAKGLTNATTLTETLDQTQPIIDALRQLSTAHPDQPVLREQLAKGLFNGFVMAMKSGDQERAKKFFEELVALIQAHPDERGIIQVAQILAQLFEQDGGETP